MDSAELIDLWLASIARDKGLSENTVLAYARTMRTVPDPLHADREDIENWARSRSEMSISTRNSELSIVRTFYKWCAKWEHREDDPTARIEVPKIPKGLPHPISRAELHRLLTAAGDEDRRAVCLGAYGGLRVSEAASLMWADIDTEFNRIRIKGKGGKERLIGLSPLLMDEIAPEVVGGNVVTGTTKVYSAGTLQRRLNRAIHDAGIDNTFHALRHRYATVALATTGNVLAVSRALGHSSPATTAIYAAASDADLDVIADAVCR